MRDSPPNKKVASSLGTCLGLKRLSLAKGLATRLKETNSIIMNVPLVIRLVIDRRMEPERSLKVFHHIQVLVIEKFYSVIFVIVSNKGDTRVSGS